ncbi:MAG: Hpt domain-containing protein [Deltaproteobacteria bacterium]|nr:Hpt domain-containing protein [Deltaproteobacteria bacterium]
MSELGGGRGSGEGGRSGGGLASLAEGDPEARALARVEAETRLAALVKVLPALAGNAKQDEVATAHRAAHSLKALAAPCGVPALAEVARAMELALDGVRGGRLAGAEVVEAVAEAVEWVGESLSTSTSMSTSTSTSDARVVAVLAKLRPFAQGGTGTTGQFSAAQKMGGVGGGVIGVGAAAQKLDPTTRLPRAVTAALTEHELSRVAVALRAGQALATARVGLALAAIDRELEQARAVLSEQGEVIACLPALDITDPALLELDFLVAVEAGVLERALRGRLRATVAAVPLSPSAPGPTTAGRGTP